MALDFSKSSKMINKVMGEAEDTNMDEKKRDIPVDQIDEYPLNEYLFGYENQDFADEVIGEDGFHGVIEVCAMENGRYEILSGHRRFRACKANGYKSIPCVVNEYLPDDERLKRVIRGNLLNRVLTPLNYARCLKEYEKVLMKGSKEEQKGIRDNMARFFHISPAAVGRYLSLNNLIPEFQELCDKNNYPYTNLMPVSSKPEKIQKKVYDALLKIAPGGNVAELSRSIIEQQVNIILQREDREKENKQIGTRGVIPKADVLMTDSPLAPVNVGPENKKTGNYTAADIHERENTEPFIEDDEAEDDIFTDSEPVNVNPVDEREEQETEVFVPEEEKNEPRDREMDFYLSRLEKIVEDAIFENKEKIIKRLQRLMDVLSE